jgi:hypothetical protein
MEKIIVDLANHRSKNSRVYSGRPRGRLVRKELKLDTLDKDNSIYEFLIPLDTFSVNTSFFLGLFGESVRSLSENGFRSKYLFPNAKESILKNINSGIERALKEKSVLSKDSDINPSE